MYQVYCDGNLLYDPRIEELKIFNKKVNLEVNTAGGFDFKIYPSHPLYNRIERIKSTIEVYQDNHRIFRGRVLDDEQDFYNAKDIICEGDLAFFNDSIIRPFEFQGSITDFLQWIIERHNEQVEDEKKFSLGKVTVETTTNYVNRSSIDPLSSWEVISTRLLDLIGGFIMVRRENGTNYIDYLQDSEYRSTQEITLGENLLDLFKSIKGRDIITALIPYGTRLEDEEGNETDQRLTIESVNDGVDYVYNEEAVEKYGWIFDTKTWDDVTLPENLLSRANDELGRRINLQVTIEVKAVDLSMTDVEIDQLRFFEYIKVNSPKHLLDSFMLVSKLELDLDYPQNNTLTLGLDYATFMDSQLNTEKSVKELNYELGQTKADTSNSISQTEQTLQTSIEQSAESVRIEAEEKFTTKDEFKTYQETTSTEFEQTSEMFEFTFNELKENIETLDGETQAQFEEFVKYIRFIDGNIVLGQVGNEITLRLMNNRIQFIQNGAEVAFFSNNKLYVTDVEVLQELKIGSFAYIPRSNGSLDFKRVVN